MREDVLFKLKQLYNEIEKRKCFNKIFSYNKGSKVHQKQLDFHKCLKRNRWVFGGNRSGKTECGAVEVVYLARGIHPFKKNKSKVEGWVVSLTSQVQRDVAQKKVLSYLNPNWIEDVVMASGRKDFLEGGIIDYILVKNVSGEISKIGFKSCDQGREKFQGASLDFVWFDEEPPREIYVECRMRVIDKCGEIFGTMTPLKGLTWVYDEIYLNCHNDSEVWYEMIEWKDNPFLSPKEVQNIELTLCSDELESRKYGRFCGSNGMVYKEFDENVHVIEPFDVPKDWFDKISIDPGLKNPLSAHWYAVDYDGNVYVIAEHFEANKDVEYHTSKIKEICESLNWPKNFNGKYLALIDSAANQKTLNGPKSVAELFYDFGVQVDTNVNKDLFSGISRVKNYLKDGLNNTKLYIFKNCVNLIKEFKSYFWGTNDSPIKRDDHCLDELRYYIMSKPNLQKPEIEKTEIEKHMEKMIRRNNYRKFAGL